MSPMARVDPAQPIGSGGSRLSRFASGIPDEAPAADGRQAAVAQPCSPPAALQQQTDAAQHGGGGGGGGGNDEGNVSYSELDWSGLEAPSWLDDSQGGPDSMSNRDRTL